MSDYRPYHAVRFLDSLAPTMAVNSLMHVRALMSGIFAHAVGEGRLDVNPIRDAKRREETNPLRPTEHYSLTEIVSILRALEGHLDAQLAIALGYFGGMRTAEISGLQWGDISNDWSSIALTRSVWKGLAAPCKTKGSQRTIPPSEPLRSMLQKFKATQTASEMQYVLVNSLLRPLDLGGLSRRTIRPVLKARGLSWKG